jgi:hypothetical protein
MAVFPGYAQVLADSVSESFEPSVLRTEMERGVPKERIQNSQVMATLSLTALFMGRDDANAFVNWYLDTIGRIGWFDFPHPRTGQVVRARFVGGAIGQLKSEKGRFERSTCPLTVEYLR